MKKQNEFRARSMSWTGWVEDIDEDHPSFVTRSRYRVPSTRVWQRDISDNPFWLTGTLWIQVTTTRTRNKEIHSFRNKINHGHI